MPPRDPTKVQLDFPLLNADLIRTLRLVGTIGLLDFIPAVQPTFIVGSRGLSITQEKPLYTSSEIFDGQLNNPAANAIVVDTGQVLAGDYDIQCWMAIAHLTGVSNIMEFEHRNAANSANLTRWFIIAGVANSETFHAEFALTLAENERLRVRSATGTTQSVGATIALKRRLTP